MGKLAVTAEFRQALALLEAGQHLFLTGKAGTGKSTLVRHFLATTTKRCLVVAPTGIAALNVDGTTIHRLFGFQPSTTVEDVEAPEWNPRRNTRLLKSLQTLIIDEASMVRADVFDCIATALRRFGPHPGEQFGGVQIVLVGDLYQLPPVVLEAEREYFATTYDTPYFFSATAYDPDAFPTVQLTRIFRQAGDDALTDILNGIREGTIDDDARAMLNSRTDASFEPPLGEFWLTLTATNRIAGARNREQLDRLDTPLHRHQSTRTGDLDRFEPPTDDDLRFKVGAQVMMLANDPANRFVNGTLGRIVAWDEREGEARIATADGSEFSVGAHTWDVTRPSVVGGRLTHEVIGTYTQLPFKLAWAITIHKSQGQTLERLHVDLSGGTFAYGQLYVALSRATSMEGLVLKRDVLPRDVKTDNRIRRFLATGSGSEGHRGHVYVAMIPVGDEGRMWRPRPLELAAITDDGEQMATLVDPQRDLGEARRLYDVTASEAALAPTLVDAWAALSPLLDGRVPVGVDVDRELGWIDFEFKRLGRIVPMPSGIDLDPDHLTPDEQAGLRAPTALERARAVQSAAARLAPKDPFADEFGPATGEGYTLARRGVAPRLASRGDLASLLREELDGKVLAPEERKAVREVERRSGVDILGESGESSSVGALLAPGTRVCFTGTVLDASGRTLGRDEVEALARECGLVPVANVTKTRCDVLVCAEAGTQSGKAKKAVLYGKPILLADDFLAWGRSYSSRRVPDGVTS